MFTLQVRKLFRKTLVFWSTTPQRPKCPPTRLGLEVLEDRTLLSVSSLPVVSSQAESPFAVATSSMFALVEQRVEQVANFLQYASNVVNTLDWEIVQEVTALQLQVGRILGINLNTPSPSSNAVVSQPSGAGQNHASGSGSGSGAMTKTHDAPHPRLEKAVPLTDSGSGSGSAPSGYSGSATVYGPVWLDNNADASQDNGEMDYAGATVYLDRSTDGGATWSFCASTTTSGAKYGNNYSIQQGFPVPNNWLYKILVVFPPYCAATTPSAQSYIDAQGYSQVFSLAPGAGQFIPAGLVSMNVNTTTDDPAGVTQQNTVTLRDAIQTGNKLKPFPAVTFMTLDPETEQFVPLSGTIYLQSNLDNIEKSYNINGPGYTTLAVDGDDDTNIFNVNAGVTSTISGLKITDGYGRATEAGGIGNSGNLTLNNDWICNNRTDGSGGGISNNTGSQLSLQQVLINCNKAASGGGGIFNAGTVYIYNGVTIMQNTSGNGGAGIDNANGTISANSSVTISWNTNTGGASGGVLNAGGKFQIFDGASIYDNKSAGNGGGVSNSGGTMTLQGVQLYNNNSGADGAGIYVGGGKLTLTDVSIGDSGKNIARLGGGMYVKEGTVKMSGGSIAYNSATYTGGTKGGGFIHGGGGGLYVGGGSVTLTGVSISNNLSGMDGAGVYNDAGGNLTLNNNVNIASNRAANQGGGMFLANQSTTNFNGVTVSNNTANDVWKGWPIGIGVYEQNGARVLPNPPNLTDNDDPGKTPDKGP